MSAKHLPGINLNECACGQSPIRRVETVGSTTLYWVVCPKCGIRTHKEDCQLDAECAWNDGDVLMCWQLPIESSCCEQVPGPVPAGFSVVPPAPAA